MNISRALLFILLPLFTLCTATAETVKVHIVGLVNRPGPVALPASENFQDSVRRLSGGFAANARLDAIQVSRKTPDSDKTVTTYTHDFTRPNKLTVGEALADGDIIFVPHIW